MHKSMVSSIAIPALRTATENGEGMLNKDATCHDDLFDAFKLSLEF